MEDTFWHKLWEETNPPFHRAEANPFLVNHLNALSLSPHSRIFIPLCGKTLDIGWLMAQGHHVIGAELSITAINQLFTQLHLTPNITDTGNFQHYSAENIDIFVGDFFKLRPQDLGQIDAIYDRGSLVALPTDMRVRYAMQLMEITQDAPQLLISFVYRQDEMSGPPFAITKDEIAQHYSKKYTITKLAEKSAAEKPGRPKDMKEQVWYLKA